MKGGRKKKHLERAKNKRLDILFTKIEKDNVKKKVDAVEDMTFEVLKGKSSPKLRLEK